MALSFIGNPGDPALADVLAITKKELMLSLNAHHIGTIQSFDSTKQIANATINYKKTFFVRQTSGQYLPELVDYPQLVDCPVIILGGGNGVFTAPVTAGDECLILFNDRDMDNWFRGNSNTGPNSARLHSFSDGIILVGVRSLAHSLANYDTTRICMRSKAGETVVGVNPVSRKVLVTNTAPGNATTLNTLLQQILTHLEALATACAAITVTVSSAPGTSSVPLNATTFTTAASNLSSDATALAALLE